MGRIGKKAEDVIFLRDGYRMRFNGCYIEEKQGYLNNLVSRCLIVLFLSCANLIALKNAFQLPVNIALIVLSCLVASMLTAVCSRKCRPGIRLAVFMAAVLLLLFILNPAKIENGLILCISDVFQSLEHYYRTEFGYGFIIDGSLPPGECIRNFLILVNFLYAVFLTVLNWNRVRVMASVLPSVAVLVLILNVGKKPAGWAIILYLLAVLFLLILNNQYQSDRIFSYYTVWKQGAIVAAVVILAYLLALPQLGETYYNRDLAAWKTRINQLISDASWGKVTKIFQKDSEDPAGSEVGEVPQGELPLGTVDGIAHSGKIMFTAEVGWEQERDYYLKNFVGSVYENNTWKTEAESFPAELAKYAKEIISRPSKVIQDTLKKSRFYETTIMVSNFGEDASAMLLPEYTKTADLMLTIEDDKVPRLSLDANALVYELCGVNYENTMLLELKPSVLAENSTESSMPEWQEQYEQYVREKYLQIPDTMERFQQEFSGVKVKIEDQEYDLTADRDMLLEQYGMQVYVNYIRGYLNDYAYSLQPGACPQGEDFVEDFLFQKKQGYCMHFATAAAMMFRQFGIPARYVSGYLVEQELFVRDRPGSSTAQVPDENAHAWVEIYQSGLGWVPVEVTTGFEPETEETTPAVQEETTTESAEEATTEEESMTDPQTTTTETPAAQQTDSVNIPWKWIFLGIGLICLPLLLWYGFSLYRKLRLRPGKRGSDPLKLQRRVFRILSGKQARLTETMSKEEILAEVEKLWGSEAKKQTAAWLRLLERGFYSRGGMEPGVVRALERRTDALLERIYPECGLWQRFLIKYIWCLF